MKSLCLLLFACAVLLSLADGRNWPNPGRKLYCWPEVLKFGNFLMQVDFSTRQNKDQTASSVADFKSRKIDFDPRRRTAIIIHGVAGYGHANLMKLVRDSLLDWKDMNVINLHWELGSSSRLLYHFAAVNTEFAALELSSFLNDLANHFEKTKNIGKQEWGPLHIIGYSLGAHVAGQTAALLRRDFNWPVHRVTGLDPAEPCFNDAGNPLRLNHTNARFVDVIHTDGARFRDESFGLLHPSGHADFYVNGGSFPQPGCESSYITLPNSNDKYLNYAQLFLHNSCSHERVVWLFILSLKQATENKCKFWGHPWRLGTSEEQTNVILRNKCDAHTCPEMGINAEFYNYNNRSSFYVKTGALQPFCNV